MSVIVNTTVLCNAGHGSAAAHLALKADHLGLSRDSSASVSVGSLGQLIS